LPLFCAADAAQPVFLRYKLAPTAMPPPVLLHAMAGLRSADALRPRAALTLVVQFAARPGLAVSLQDVILDVDVHPLLGEPAKVRRLLGVLGL
jgi:hypothetical protein